jgi:alkylhydroperoxidase/carboxymuconolactone decarboxylase family protein YurZ
MDNPPQQRDGLALLQSERPEVMKAYLRLLGSLGESLEPKVKQLVLIALQVTQGSSRALRRHVPRALEAGASRQEVLDAIVLALPVAGLTRTTEALASVADLLTPSGSPSQVHAQPYVENHV